MYLVTKLLPERDGEFEYFIRSAQEAHERIARENKLRGASWSPPQRGSGPPI